MKKNKKNINKKVKAVSPSPSFLSPKLRALAEHLQEIQKIARQHGIFVDDRELLECPQCHLLEDVAFDGKLLTYIKGTKENKDSGLRFIELDSDKNQFNCPNCNQVLMAPMRED